MKATTYAFISPPCDRPMAAPGLLSFRYGGRYGYIMIGAKDTADALREAARSTHDPITVDKLQQWDGVQYGPAFT